MVIDKAHEGAIEKMPGQTFTRLPPITSSHGAHNRNTEAVSRMAAGNPQSSLVTVA